VKQVIQNFKSGHLFVDDVSIPAVGPGFVLVRNHFSLISAGTERSTVSTGKASLLGKARQRPDLVKQVLDTLKKEGFSETLMRIRTKLDTLKELGYSSAGTVIMSMDTKGLFHPGDRVACGGGGYASHSAVVSVPQNLVVRLPDNVPLDQAAFTTLGAIAMQGVRQADPKLGDFVCVIGLGLLGHITAQILRANGCQVFGIDTSSEMVNLAKELSCHRSVVRDSAHLDSETDFFTEGQGFDSVIITAASQTADPVELATLILRKKGSIVVVGAVPMNIPREPHFYKKELELKISCSYGPGRYDHTYEEEGHDYPYSYVRWTENRNMAAFVKLLECGAVKVKPLISHVIDIGDAENAYDIITGKLKERYIGILLGYGEKDKYGERSQTQVASRADSKGIGFIGAGSFAQKFLIPHAASAGKLVGVVTTRGVTAKNAGDKFKFSFHSTDPKDVLENPDIDTVFIATRHDSHGQLVVDSLKAGKHVFVEKPLTIKEEELREIVEVAEQHPSQKLMVGFNRRFAPLSVDVREMFAGFSEPLLINYRVNAGYIPLDHWTQRVQGGGRIIGEVCHFIDLMQFFADSEPNRVFAHVLNNPNTKIASQDNVVITISFRNGSVGVITYVASGDKSLAKERVEIFGGGKSAVIDNFRVLEFYSGGKRRIKKKPGKGYKQEVDVFFQSVRDGEPSPISLKSLLLTTLTTFRVLDSLQTGLPQRVELS